MDKNNIPQLLDVRGWSKYKLWQKMGGKVGDRSLVYERLVPDGAEFSPIPPNTHWGTLKRVAKALSVSIADLEWADRREDEHSILKNRVVVPYKIDPSATPAPNDIEPDEEELARFLGEE